MAPTTLDRYRQLAAEIEAAKADRAAQAKREAEEGQRAAVRKWQRHVERVMGAALVGWGIEPLERARPEIFLLTYREVDPPVRLFAIGRQQASGMTGGTDWVDLTHSLNVPGLSVYADAPTGIAEAQLALLVCKVLDQRAADAQREREQAERLAESDRIATQQSDWLEKATAVRTTKHAEMQALVDARAADILRESGWPPGAILPVYKLEWCSGVDGNGDEVRRVMVCSEYEIKDPTTIRAFEIGATSLREHIILAPWGVIITAMTWERIEDANVHSLAHDVYVGGSVGIRPDLEGVTVRWATAKATVRLPRPGLAALLSPGWVRPNSMTIEVALYDVEGNRVEMTDEIRQAMMEAQWDD